MKNNLNENKKLFALHIKQFFYINKNSIFIQTKTLFYINKNSIFIRKKLYTHFFLLEAIQCIALWKNLEDVAWEEFLGWNFIANNPRKPEVRRLNGKRPFGREGPSVTSSLREMTARLNSAQYQLLDTILLYFRSLAKFCQRWKCTFQRVLSQIVGNLRITWHCLKERWVNEPWESFKVNAFFSLNK